MPSFLLIVKGDVNSLERALDSRGLDAYNPIDHQGRMTCYVAGPPQTASVLEQWSAQKKEDNCPDGALLHFKKLL